MQLLELAWNLVMHIRKSLYPSPLAKEDKLLLDARQAREQMLCMLSIYNETSGQADIFEVIAYRLLAAEKLYSSCLNRLRQERISCLPLPYTCSHPRRGLYLEGLWYPFPLTQDKSAV